MGSNSTWINSRNKGLQNFYCSWSISKWWAGRDT